MPTSTASPTMGGLVFVGAAIVGYLVAHVRLFTLDGGFRPQCIPFGAGGLLAVMAMVGMGIVGFPRRLHQVRPQAQRGTQQANQVRAAAVDCDRLHCGRPGDGPNVGISTEISFVRPLGLDLGVFFVLWALFMLTGAANGVNLADGMDGLAGGSAALVTGAYTVIAFWQFRNDSVYQSLDPLDLATVAAAMFGALLGFLWWNAPPAQIFMGDVGSQAIGGLLAALALLTNTHLLLVDPRGDLCRRDPVGDDPGGRAFEPPATGCSGWRRSISTSTSEVGPRPPPLSASGSLPGGGRSRSRPLLRRLPGRDGGVPVKGACSRRGHLGHGRGPAWGYGSATPSPFSTSSPAPDCSVGEGIGGGHWPLGSRICWPASIWS